LDFKLPDLGEGIQEAEIISVNISPGDKVKEDQSILEVETDKARVEIPSPVAGKVEKVLVKEGDIVTVGSVMVSFTDIESGHSHAEERPKESRETKPIREQKNEIATNHSQVQAGVATAEKNLAFFAPARPIPAAPTVRRMARELGVDLRCVKASGPAGRVLMDDVVNQASGAQREASAGVLTKPETNNLIDFQRTSAFPGQAVDLPDFSKFGPIEQIPLRSIRRKTAESMALSWAHIPHVTHFDEADITELEKLRSDFEIKSGNKVRLTITAFTLKAIALALQKYPQFNASLNEKEGVLIYKKYFNIGMAVATDRGLIVPVIKDVDRKSILDLAKELSQIAEKTRAGKIEPEQLHGGTFTVTNVGAIGGTSMVPMIKFPEAAILGMAKSTQKPIVKNGKIEIGLILPLALSFDHRIADGAEAAYFVQHIVQSLQEPKSIFKEV
jgi:pyruvate dehydrogenase E2 component (dihydrolipoamide acetyltransferase)